MIEFTGDNKLLKFCDALMEMDYGFHIKNCVNPTVHNALMKITNRTQTNTMTFISDDIHSICISEDDDGKPIIDIILINTHTYRYTYPFEKARYIHFINAGETEYIDDSSEYLL